MVMDGAEEEVKGEGKPMDCSKHQKRMKDRDLGVSCMVNTEVGALLTVMRMNPVDMPTPQFGIHGTEEAVDTSFINSLKSLRTFIFNLQQDWHSINPSIYLSPFLDVIQYEEISAAAAGISLSAILKILRLDIFNTGTPRAREAMHSVVEAIANCRLERANMPADDAILMRILQLLVTCLKCKGSPLLSDNAVCTIVNTCFQIVQQSASRGHVLQRCARHTMHELVQMIFARLPDLDSSVEILLDNDHISTMNYGIGAIIDIFQFICSLLNLSVEVPFDFDSTVSGPDEDIQLFALILINSAIELGGEAIARHQKLLGIIQDDLFFHLIHYGSNSSPLVLSMICSTALNLYHHLRSFLKLQLEAFFWFVCLKIAGGKLYTAQQEEVAIEGLVSFCRQPKFGVEMYMNFDCDPMRENIFEEIGKLLCKKASPGTGPLTSIQSQSFDGMVVMIQNIADGIDGIDRTNSNLKSPEFYDAPSSSSDCIETTKYRSFWTEKCEDYGDSETVIEFVRMRKCMKKRLMVSSDHFNRDEKKGLEFLKHSQLVPDPPDAHSIAYFLRYTQGVDKTLVGDYLGDPDEFHIQVLKEFTSTFNFTNMTLDIALRNFLETFRLPGEAQKIQRVLEAFAERFYVQSDETFADKDAVMVLCYSLIMLNTDQHNVQVKKKMTEEEFIRNNRNINGGEDLPREYLSELFQSIANNEITLADQSAASEDMNPSRWIYVINQSNNTDPYISCDTRPWLNRDMFSTLVGPSIATIAAIFEHTNDDNILKQCMEGFIAVARVARYKFEDVLDELLAMLCKFTTLLNPFSSLEETLFSFAEDVKPKIATLTVFTIANKFGDSIRSGWRNIVDCLLRLKKLKLLPPSLSGAEVEAPADRLDLDVPLHSRAESCVVLPLNMNSEGRFSSLMGKFTAFLSAESNDERMSTGSRSIIDKTLQFINQCCIDSIFSKAKYLDDDSLQHLGRALLMAAAGRTQKFTSPLDEEDTAGFCWDLIVMITVPNLNRFMSFWPAFHEYLAMTSQLPIFASCPFVEKSLCSLLNISKKLLLQSDSQSEELIFKSLQVIWRIDGQVGDACCEEITQLAANVLIEDAKKIQTEFGWQSVLAVLSMGARHPEAFNDGIEALIFLMSANGAYLTSTNYNMCIETAFSFAASKVSSIEQSKQLIDLMADSMPLLISWHHCGFADPDSSVNSGSSSSFAIQDSSGSSTSCTTTMFMKLVENLRKMCLIRREEIRNYAVSLLRRCFVKAEELGLTSSAFMLCFNNVAFAMADDLLEKAVEYSRRENSEKEMHSTEGTLILSMEFLADTYVQFLPLISTSSGFKSFWLGVLRRMDACIMAELGGSDSLKILVQDLLRRMIIAMKERNILMQKEDNELWDVTVTQILKIAPAVKDELLSEN
ncbi:ARF guanine-nucleotide exchange factor GNL2-like [Nymphaea colorata]|nr:ARF guanine-nucleotide exchange factor GNL2-like [Nymphaea colorata]